MSNLIVDENTRCLGKIMRSLVWATPSVQTATSLAEARVFLRDRPSWVHCLDLQLHEAHRTEIPTPWRISRAVGRGVTGPKQLGAKGCSSSWFGFPDTG